MGETLESIIPALSLSKWTSVDIFNVSPIFLLEHEASAPENLLISQTSFQIAPHCTHEFKEGKGGILCVFHIS